MGQIRVISGDLEGQVFGLILMPITIGRESDNVISIDESKVSRHHAVLIPAEAGYTLRDLNSTNGTFVNGQPTQERRLLDGDVIRVGCLEMQYESNVADRPAIPTSARPAEFTVEKKSAGGAFPIPPRVHSLPPRLPSVSVTPTPLRDVGIRFEISYSTGGNDFIRKAQKYVRRRETQAQFVPFMSYWPTYGSMTDAQQRWYFYWRDQVRNGIYPDTDLSYVFVHVYELINNVGIENGVDGYWTCMPPITDMYLI